MQRISRLIITGVQARVAIALLCILALVGPVWAQGSTPPWRGRTVLILASEQLGPDQIIRWTDLVWGPDRVSTKTTAMVAHRESGVVAATLSSALRARGMKVIDPTVLRGKLKKERDYEIEDLGADTATTVARKTDAELVLTVRATAKLASNSVLADSNMTSAQATIVARLIETRTGEVVAAATSHAAKVHIDPDTARSEALAAATKDCVKQLLSQPTTDEDKP